jgi:hypothetical protein
MLLYRDNMSNTMRDFFNENPFLTKVEGFLHKTIGSFIGDLPYIRYLPPLKTA